LRMKIDAISFDLDNTMYPQMEYETAVFELISAAVEREYGVNGDVYYDRLMDLFKKGERHMVFDRAMVECLGRLPKNWRRFVIGEILPTYRSSKVNIKLFDGVLDILKKLRKMVRFMVVITDGNTDLQMNKIDLLGIEDIFDRIYISDSYTPPARKPDTRMFKDFLEDFKLDPSRTMHVGDDENKDGACKKLGIRFFKIESQKDWTELLQLFLP